MEAKDIMWLSLKDLSEKKIRTALTVMMVAIGVASIIALISQTQGISNSISAELSSLGPTSIILSSSSSTGFTSADTARISTLAGVNYTIPIVTGSASALANGHNTSVTIIGISPQGLQELLGNVSLYQGSMYQDTLSPSSVIGYDVAFPSSSSSQVVTVGQPLTLELQSGKSSSTYTVPVSGVLESYGTSIISIDTGVMMSLQEAQELLHRDSYATIIVKAKNLSDVTPLSTLLSDIYGSSARVLTTQQLLETTSSIIGSISELLGVVAGISLLVAAIGIMNVMLIAVYERTHEIGIMKSLGFKRKHILTIFLSQAMIIGLVGGISGIIIGVGASYTLSAVISHASSASTSTNATTTAPRGGAAAGGFGGGGGAFVTSGGGGAAASPGSSSSLSYSPAFTPETILLSLSVAVLVSVLAGVYPAWRASKMEPIDALRQL